MDHARIELAPCAPGAVALLQHELEVSAVMAQVLARRAYAEPARAQAFIAAQECHDARAFVGIDAIAAQILGHVRSGAQITIHGDYDVDGICSSAILVRVMRALGGNVDSYVPDRASDGYGLNNATVERLASRGTKLLVTVDCGITAVAEVARARALGVDVIVSDHHAPPSKLPDAPILHPLLSGYPCTELCAAALAHKLAKVLALDAPAGVRELVADDLDLVALATIADSVPLRGENRTLARQGLRALARTLKPGLRALMEQARVDPARLDERAVAFGLAPRLNAAGRLYRADAALELLMCTEESRAREIARELDRANSERRDAQTRVLFEAEKQVAAMSRRNGYVLAGERWHAGVIGIVAARLAERHGRPFVLIALEGERGKGSARSIDGFDLTAALTACEEHLVRYGGHRAAAGLEVDREELQRFGATFDRYACARLSELDLVPAVRVDAIVHGQELGLELAEELGALAPFGQGNPPVSLLVRGCRIANVRTMGEGRHLRFDLHADGARMGAVAFGFGSRVGFKRELAREASFDAVFRLEVNEWRGITEPRLSLVHLQPAAPAMNTFGITAEVPYPVEHGRRDQTLAG